jgi:hypothetical protein
VTISRLPSTRSAIGSKRSSSERYERSR